MTKEKLLIVLSIVLCAAATSALGHLVYLIWAVFDTLQKRGL